MSMSGVMLGITVVQVALLAGISIFDLQHRSIHPGALLALAAASLLRTFASQSPLLQSALVGALFAGGAFGLAYLGGRAFCRQFDLPPTTVVFGLGDVWLGAVCGLACGFPGALAVVLLAMLFGGFCAGIFVAVASWRGGGYRPMAALPYGQNIAAATGFALLFPAEVAQVFAG